MSQQNVISLPSIGHLVGDLAQKRPKYSLLKMLVSIAAKNIFGKLYFFLGFKYIKAQKNHSP